MIATTWNADLAAGDWTLADGRLLEGSALQTAVLISVFTDRKADPDDVLPDGTADPRGWWADLGADRPIGCKLWLRVRAKRTSQILALVQADLAEALAWLTDDEVAARVDVACEWLPGGQLGAQVTVHRTEAGAAPATLRFEWAWQGEG